jgi:hypothetical protein
LRAGGDGLERLYAKLAADEEDGELDRVLEADASREESIRSAVTDVLIPTLSGAAREIAEHFDPLQLYRAMDAASVRVYTEVGLGERQPALITFASSGDVFFDVDAVPAISAREIASEIASFAALWRFVDERKNERETLWDQALTLARWVPLALADQPDLLLHFRRNSFLLSLHEFRRRLPDRIPVFLLRVEERIKDAALRWMPAATADALFLVQNLPGGEGGFVIGELTEGYLGPLDAAVLLREDAYIVRAEAKLRDVVGARGASLHLGRFATMLDAVRAAEVKVVRLMPAKMEVVADESSTIVRGRRVGAGLGAAIASGAEWSSKA